MFLQCCFHSLIVLLIPCIFFPASLLAAQVSFSWLPNTESTLAGYKIHYGTTSGDYTNVIDVGLPQLTDGRVCATVDNLTAGQTYYFAATAYNSAGVESDYSTEISTTVLDETNPSPSSGQAEFSWLPNTEDTLAGYKIHYGTASGTYTTVVDVGKPDPVDGRIYATVTGLTEGTTYYFAATAYNTDNVESDYSTELSYTVPVTTDSTPPVANNTAVSGTEDSIITGQLDVTNTNGLSLQYINKTSPSSGSLILEDATGLFTFIPQPDFFGQDSFNFTATNSNGESNTATVTMTVAPVNDSPVANSSAITVNEDTTASGLLTATDPDNDTLTFALVAMPANGAATVAGNGSFTYTPGPDATGTDTFTFKVNDGTTDSNTATVTITINPVNDPPVANSATISVIQGATTNGQLVATDSDSDSLTYSLVSSPTIGSVTINTNGSYTYQANSDATGTDAFSFKANDGGADSNTAMINITITERPTDLQFEVGELQVSSSWQTVTFDSSFREPVIIAGSTSLNDPQPGVIRVKNVTNTGFEIRFQEWDSLDGEHSGETVTYMVMEKGSFVLDNGIKIEAGCFPAATTGTFSTISLADPMNQVPVILTAIDSTNEDDAATGRIRNITKTGFDFMMQEQEANTAEHAGETGCYIAWEPSAGMLGDMLYEVARTGNEITQNSQAVQYTQQFPEPPLLLADMQTTDGQDTAVLRVTADRPTGATVLVSEEQSRDTETYHTTEVAGYLAIGSYDPTADPDSDGLKSEDEINIYHTHPGLADTDRDGLDDGREVTFWQDNGIGWSSDVDNDSIINLLDPDSDDDGITDGVEVSEGLDPADPGSTPDFPSIDAGEISLDHNWVHVNFSASFTRPVVVARLLSRHGTDPCVLRIANVTDSGFDIRIQEYEYLNGPHILEQASYLVMEAGHYTLSDGTQLEAGTFDSRIETSFTDHGFSQEFSRIPIVITAITSYNETDTVTGRMKSVSTSGFYYNMQEQEFNAQSHTTETISYIAWEPSNGTAGNINFAVGRSGDVVTGATTTLDYGVTFTATPLVITDMETTDGADTAGLRTLGSSASDLDVMVEEEQSKDSETSHTTEAAGFIAILAN